MEKFRDGASLNKTDKTFLAWDWGTNEPNPFPGSVGAFKAMLEKQGCKVITYYESQGTATRNGSHGERDLYQFAQLLF